MTLDLPDLRKRLAVMMVVSTLLTFVAVGFAFAYFFYSVKWAIWGFVGFLAVGFAVQMWFIRGFARTNKGN